MSGSLPFLQYLGLDEGSANERAIRRAYARLLKAIDQEADPAAFQSLREAYDAALQWMQRGQRGEDVAVQARVPEEDAKPAAVPVDSVFFSPGATDAMAPPSNERPPEFGPESEAIASAVLGLLMARLKSDPPADTREGRRRLDRMLEDPRLLDLDAHFLVEWGLASAFAQGWQPGHEHLFGPAVVCFKWHEDRPRLERLGRAGQLIDRAVSELALHESQPDLLRGPQRELIRRLRSDRRPGNQALAEHLPMAERLLAVWPNWLHVVTNTKNILAWRRWHAEPLSWHGTGEGWSRSAQRADRMALLQGWAALVFLAFMAIASLVYLFSSNPPPTARAVPKAGASSPSAAPGRPPS